MLSVQLQKLGSRLYPNCLNLRVVKMSSHLGDLGRGAGKGGGGGGAIREAGGAFGRQEAAREEEYFHKQQQEQLKKLRDEQAARDGKAPTN